MVGSLLLRGMLAGLIAGLVCFAFLKLAGEASVDQAIAFESAMEAAHHEHDHGDDAADETVGRDTQSGIGLLTGTAIYGASFGGLFALAFAFAYGRVGPSDPRALSALLALAAFLAVYFVPNLKYSSNPPAVGQPDTIAARTALYFGMMAISVVTAIAAVILRQRLLARLDGWNASLAAAVLYLLVVAGAAIVLPPVDEVPADFSASLLWYFRIASIGGQAVLWAVTGLLFGWFTLRAERRQSGVRLGRPELNA
jgi:predicted cobalt transporter CbtA